MRQLVFSALILFCCVAMTVGPAVDANAQAMDAKGIKAAVDQYTDPKATDSKRESMLAALAKCPQPEVVKSLKAVAKKADRKESALRLSILLGLRGMFDSFSKDLKQWPLEVATLGLQSADKGAAAFLIKEWKALDEADEVWASLNQALETCSLDWEHIEDLKDYASNEANPAGKSLATGKIIKAQLSLETEDIAEIGLLWSALVKEAKPMTKRQALTGIDLAQHPAATQRGGRRVGPNHHFPSGGYRTLNEGPASLEKGPYKVSFWVWLETAPESGGAGLMFRENGEERLYQVQGKNQKWVVTKNSETENHAELKAKAWTCITVMVEPCKRSNGSDGVKITYSVDGKAFSDTIQAEQAFIGFQVGFPDTQWLLGGVDYVRL